MLTKEDYRLIADSAHDWEDWRSPDGRLRYVSPSCERITGYSREEFLSDPDLLERIIHPDDREAFARHYGDAEAPCPAEGLEFRLVRRDGEVRWLGHHCRPVYDSEGRFLGRRANHRDITEQVQAYRRVEHLASFPEMNPSPVLEVSSAGEIMYQNPATARALQGVDDPAGARAFIPGDLARVLSDLAKPGAGAVAYREVEVGQETFLVGTYPVPEFETVRLYVTSITARKQHEQQIGVLAEEAQCQAEELQTANEELLATNLALQQAQGRCDDIIATQERETALLHLITEAPDAPTLIRHAGDLLCGWFDCDAIAVRWRRGDDCPYVGHCGYPEDLVATENSLCQRDENGEVVRDEAGVPVLECLCGAVLSGRTDPTLPFFSPGGSLWTNSTTRLLATSPEAAATETRGRCVREGYESLARVPLRFGDTIYGLLHLDSKRPDRFTPEGIAFLERMASSLALRLAQHETQEALTESEGRYRTIGELLAHGTFMTDAAGKQLYLSPAFLQLVGRDLAAMQEPGVWTSLQHPDDVQESDRLWREAVSTRRFYSREYRILGRDDQYHWILSRGVPVLDEAGEVQYWVGVNIDIDELKQAQEQAQQRAAELDTIIESIADGVSISDAEGGLIRYNKAAWRMLRYDGYETASREQRTRRCRYQRADGTEFAFEDLPLTRSLRGETVTGEIIEMVWPEGDSTWVTSSTAPLRDAEGHVAGVVLTNTDMTGLRRTQQALQEAYGRLRTLFDHRIAGIGIIIATVQGDILEANDYYLDLLGVTREELGDGEIGWMEMTPPQWRPADEDCLVQLAEREVCDPYEKEYVRRDGIRVPVLIVSAMVPGEQDEVLAFVLDMTERKRAQEELQRHRDRLEELVQARTAEVAERSRVLESVFSHSLSCLVLLDTDFNFVRVNEAYAQARGRPVEDFVGHNHFVDYPSAEMQAVFGQVLRTKQPWQMHARPFEFPDHPEWGTSYWDLSLVPIVDEAGEVALLLFSLQDVTEHRRAEEQLLEHQHSLRSLASMLSLAEERERRRLATSIHDDLSQNLAFAKLKLTLARQAEQMAEAAQPLHEVGGLLDEAIRYTRALTFEISPPVLYQLGFEPALEWLAEHMEQRHGYAARVVTDEQAKPLSQDLKVRLFQAVRELLTNAAKHAQAQHVVVSVRRLGNFVEIEVADDGVGFEVATTEIGPMGGFGLFNIQEGLRHLGGRLEIASAPGAGAKFTLIAPREEEE